MIRMFDGTKKKSASENIELACKNLFATILVKNGFETFAIPSIYRDKSVSTMRNLFLLSLLQLLAIASSFSVWPGKIRQGIKRSTALASSVDDEKVIQCFIVNAFEVDEEGAFPEVVCTPEPDEYAWFNGLSRESMRPADGINEGSLECVEGYSPRGVPEWECTKKITDEVPWQ